MPLGSSQKRRRLEVGPLKFQSDEGRGVLPEFKMPDRTILPLPPETLERTAFLAGYWRGERDGVVLEEMWLPPSAGVAQGTVRLVKNGELGTIELIVVTAEASRMVMRYNHFHSDYRPWEDDGPIALTLTAASDSELIFTNLELRARHAREMGYRLTSADTLSSWVVTVNADGDTSRFSFEFERVRMSH